MKNKKEKIASFFRKKQIRILIVITAIIFTGIVSFEFKSVSGMANPAAVYCKDLGYQYTIKSAPEGDYGICHLPDGSEVDEWKFLAGEVGKEYNYCGQKGYEMKIVESTRDSMCPYGNKCAVCVLSDGAEVEVTELMNLDIKESVCGDGKCVLGENYETCSQDCPSGFFDMYCDGVSDDLCDPDCTSETDSDCIGVEKFVNVDVAVCADKNCSQKSKSFTQGETVYFKINNHINLDISSTIKTPSGEIEYLTFEDNLAVFQSGEIGRFSLWINFSERGYKKQKIEKDFVYIERTDETSPAFICGDGKCEGEENEQNCPQDCLPAKNTKFYILAAAILLAIGIAGFILYRRRVKTKNKDVY